jgi:hypothetical protein
MLRLPGLPGTAGLLAWASDPELRHSFDWIEFEFESIRYEAGLKNGHAKIARYRTYQLSSRR